MNKEKFSALVVDDNALERRLAIDILHDYTIFNPINQAKHGRMAQEMLQENSYDLVLMDIDLPYKNGLRILSEMDSIPCTIFVTGHNSHALEAFDLGATDYLLKPYAEDRFHIAITRALKILQTKRDISSDNNAIIIKTAQGRFRIPVHKINYIAAHNKRCVIHTNERDYEVAKVMQNIISLLPADKFLRIHRSYIISISQVEQINSKSGNRYSIQLRDDDETRLPVGRSYSTELRKLFH